MEGLLDYSSFRRIEFPALPRKFPSIGKNLHSLIREAGDAFQSPASCFGIEHATQYILGEKWPDQLPRKAFFRPSPEPALLSYWQDLGSAQFIRTAAPELVSVLTGKESEIREQEICARGDGEHNVLFEKANFSKWIGDLSLIYDLDIDPVFEGIVVYSRTIFSHPFRDGNGRLSRALIYGSLRRGGLINSPCLGLGPAFHYSRRALASATLELSKHANWQLYLETLAHVIAFAATQALLVKREREGKPKALA